MLVDSKCRGFPPSLSIERFLKAKIRLKQVDEGLNKHKHSDNLKI